MATSQSPQARALLEAISADRALGSSLLFGHRHRQRSPAMHVEIMDLWRCADELVLIEAFREAGKSTLSEEFLLMEGAFGNFSYCVIFAENYNKACQRIEAIVHEAKNNPKLRAMLGANKILARKPNEDMVWFSSGALIQGLGWEQEITGMKYHDKRPDRAYLDDIENLERVRDTAAVDATIRKIYRELLPAMDKDTRKVRMTQTPRARDCAVTRFRANQDWLTRSFPICIGDIDSPDTVATWPERYPMDWIRKTRDIYARAGQLKEFMQEYMLEVDSADLKPFDQSMLRWADVAPSPWAPRYAIYDPARTVIPGTSDATGKVVVSRSGSKIVVHESIGGTWRPDETRDDIFATQAKHNAIIGVEKNALDEYLLQPIRSRMLTTGQTFHVKPLQAPQDRNKTTFIMGIQPFFAAGDVILVGGPGMHPQLVAQILNFPGGKLDILNALAYAPRMFAGTPVYEDFGDFNVAEAPTRPAKVFAAWNANPSNVVCVAVVRNLRHTSIAADYAATGPLQDAVTAVGKQLRTDFPNATIESYVPADIHDQWQRIPLVPALRVIKVQAYRGEYAAIARGALLDGLRTTIRQRRLITVDARATNTLTALAGEYKFPIAGGAQATEPEPGLPALTASGLECMLAMLDRAAQMDDLIEANLATNQNGTQYITSLPKR